MESDVALCSFWDSSQGGLESSPTTPLLLSLQLPTVCARWAPAAVSRNELSVCLVSCSLEPPSPDLRLHLPTGHTVGVPLGVHKEVLRVNGDHLLWALFLRSVILAQYHLVGKGTPAEERSESQFEPRANLVPLLLSWLQGQWPGQGQGVELTRCSGLQS